MLGLYNRFYFILFNIAAAASCLVNLEESGPDHKRDKQNNDKRKAPLPSEKPVKGNKRERHGAEKATDDYHFEKFKKQYRRF